MCPRCCDRSFSPIALPELLPKHLGCLLMQVVSLAQDFFKAVPQELRASLCAISNSAEVEKLAARDLPGLKFISLGARRIPSHFSYVLLLGLTKTLVRSGTFWAIKYRRHMSFT